MSGIVITLVIYQVLMLGIGWWASRRNADSTDFYLGGRNLGGAVAALSASASSSSAWSLLGVSGAAFAWGLPALWLIPATVLGFCINWYLVAPRLSRQSRDSGAITLTEFLAGPPGDPARRTIMRLGALIILFCFTFYIAAQFQAAGKTFASVLGVDPILAIVIGAAVVLVYVWLGGFWAASVTDSVQGLLMALSALLLPLLALAAIGGPGELIASLSTGADISWTGQSTLPAAIGFVFGLFGIGLGYPGQPHVVNRFMAIRDAAALRRGRRIAIAWALVIYTGMVTLGWCGRLLVADLGDGEQVLFVLATLLLPALAAGVMVSAILSAIMSTADSQLLVAASSVSHDWRDGRGDARGVTQARWVVFIIGLLAIALAVFFPDDIFSRVLFAWQALAAAFGPLLVVTLWRGRVAPAWRVAALSCGFALTVVLSWTVESPGDWIERLLPLLAALLLSWLGARKH
ncbi:MAG: sodium/proline symporter [Gammaproteobacteria bacterium]|nr:sodium/proline symporter [Gammaproteobacteria bacterium]MBT8049978.1 sodium/proline symporter [Gammaproteobacteria bacterium]NNJ79694.1 sodium/proline symporter [Xanthomonadales bacterium]